MMMNKAMLNAEYGKAVKAGNEMKDCGDKVRLSSIYVDTDSIIRENTKKAMMKVIQPDNVTRQELWREVMAEWAENNEHGVPMHVVIRRDGSPHCTDILDGAEMGWEKLMSAQVDWVNVIDGYDDDPNSHWYVLDERGTLINMWHLVDNSEMGRALEQAIDTHLDWLTSLYGW